MKRLILFIDGIHPTQGTELAYDWIPTGKAVTRVKTSGSRTRLNQVGALNLNPIERLWKVMNEEVRNSRYFASTKLLRREIHYFFNNKITGACREAVMLN